MIALRDDIEDCCDLPRSIPMTEPLTFSSPPSVEFHRRKAAPGILEVGVRVKAARGSYEYSLVAVFATRDGSFFRRGKNIKKKKGTARLTARDMREGSIVS